jgi:hypothetical protein
MAAAAGAMSKDSLTAKLAMGLANRKDASILFAMAIGVLCLFICGIFGWFISHEDQKPVTLLVQLAGMASGGFLGFLASPKAKGEEAAFLTFAKAISAFLSGYALSKIDHLVDILFLGETLKNQLFVSRLLIFFVAMMISFMIAYSYRAYVQHIPEHELDSKKPPKEGTIPHIIKYWD